MSIPQGSIKISEIRNGKTFWMPGKTPVRVRVHGRPFKGTNSPLVFSVRLTFVPDGEEDTRAIMPIKGVDAFGNIISPVLVRKYNQALTK